MWDFMLHVCSMGSFKVNKNDRTGSDRFMRTVSMGGGGRERGVVLFILCSHFEDGEWMGVSFGGMQECVIAVFSMTITCAAMYIQQHGFLPFACTTKYCNWQLLFPLIYTIQTYKVIQRKICHH